MNKKKILLKIKHFRNYNKTIHELKKTKKPSQKPQATSNEKSTWAQIWFFLNFESKKTPNMNFSCQIE